MSDTKNRSNNDPTTEACTSGLVPAYVTEDVQFVKGTLERFYLQCQAEISGRILSRYQNQYDELVKEKETLRNQHKMDMDALRLELSETREKLSKAEKTIAKHDGLKAKLKNGFKEYKREQKELEAKKHAEEASARDELERARRSRVAARAMVSMKKRGQARAFIEWRRVARQNRRAQEEAFWQNKLKETTSKIVMTYEATLAKLRQDLATAELKVRHQQEDAGLMEERMKQALVRGVCALNRHTLTAFHAMGPDIPSGQSTSSGSSSDAPAPSTNRPPAPHPRPHSHPMHKGAIRNGLGHPGHHPHGPSGYMGTGQSLGPQQTHANQYVTLSTPREPKFRNRPGSQPGMSGSPYTAALSACLHSAAPHPASGMQSCGTARVPAAHTHLHASASRPGLQASDAERTFDAHVPVRTSIVTKRGTSNAKPKTSKTGTNKRWQR